MSKERVLIVDDESEMLDVCKGILASAGLDLITEAKPAWALERLEAEPFDAAVLDIRMPGVDGVELLRRARAANPSLAVVLMTAYPSDESIGKSVSLGAFGYVTKPFTPEQLRTAVTRALLDRRLRSAPLPGEGSGLFEGMFGKSDVMRRVFGLIEQVAPTDVEVLVTGESGTGKELVARALHSRSCRKDGHFVPVDCGAIPENLMESELFGHEKGAYTGADKLARGLLEFAHGGTLFLDEVAELPIALQAKLLRVLQERQFKRVGATDLINVNIRVIAATNRDIDRAIRDGCFRGDLRYRLDVVRIHVSPLRERREDIAGLFEFSLKREGPRFERRVEEVAPEVWCALEAYSWPGNVRELLNVVRRVLALGRGRRIVLGDLPPEVLQEGRRGFGPAGFTAQREQLVRLFERRYLEEVIARHKGDVAAVAQEVGIPRSTFYRLMKKYGLLAGTEESSMSHR